MPSEQVHLLTCLANLVIGLAMLSIAAAISFALLNSRTDARYKLMSLLFCAFFLLAGIGRMLSSFTDGYPAGPDRLVVDLLAGIVAIAAGAIIWPVARRTMSMPTYEELQQALSAQDRLRAQLAAIVQSSDDAIFSKTLDGIITSWNPAAERLYGYAPEEIIGKSVALLAPPDRHQEIESILEKLRLGEHIKDFETLRVAKDGQLRDVAITISPISDEGVIVGAAVVGRDVTGKKESQRQITRLYDNLKERMQELAEANAALQAARDQALEASSLKSAFVANISHELRTPLSGIIGMNELLLEQQHSPETTAMLQMMLDSGNTLLAIVNDILDLSKIEAGKITLEYEPFNPRHLVEECAALLSPAAAGKGLQFDVSLDGSLPESVYGDAGRVRQIILNLVGNAIKFTQDGKVTVTAQVERQDADTARLVFRVTDTGIGIGHEEQNLLFLPFTQVDSSSTRKFGGTGLGLTISKRFVDMMHGEIGVESEKGRGSTFWFKISFDKRSGNFVGASERERTPAAGIAPISAALAKDRKVLIVEDNLVLRELALRQLASLGIAAGAVATAHEAIELAGSGEVDIILMDVNLPDVSGNDATRQIRANEAKHGSRRVPIIAMTAGAMKGDRDAASQAGMDDYLTKPLRLEDLKVALDIWLSRLNADADLGKPPRRSDKQYFPRSA